MFVLTTSVIYWHLLLEVLAFVWGGGKAAIRAGQVELGLLPITGLTWLAALIS